MLSAPIAFPDSDAAIFLPAGKPGNRWDHPERSFDRHH
jgi:hypothetical protein